MKKQVSNVVDTGMQIAMEAEGAIIVAVKIFT